MKPNADPFNSRSALTTKSGQFQMYRIAALSSHGSIEKLPYSIRVLLESCLRNLDHFTITENDVLRLAKWADSDIVEGEIPFKPARVILQDFTGVPGVVDLAALRSALARLGGDPQKINPQVPVDLVVDHSIQVDFYGSEEALAGNERREFERNRERYEFLRWGQQSFDNFRIVPPGTGIVHQVNLEFLAPVVTHRENIVFPDSLVGTDSHTTMINGLGVVGWGVGGIEAEATMLGQPISMLVPEVVGFKLTGELREGTTATDLVLTVTKILRNLGVVGKFVEFFGPGMTRLSLADRATLANMAPEYGATMGFFPVDDQTLTYLRLTGRSNEQIDLVERYTKENLLFCTADAPEPSFSHVVGLDLGDVVSSLAGPKRPQDQIPLTNMRPEFLSGLSKPIIEGGFGLSSDQMKTKVPVEGQNAEIGHGSVAIAAITSCTNTSNPSVLVGAGLLAKKAVEKGLCTPPYVKTSLAPGSRVVSSYLEKLGLDHFLEQLGFFTVGYGCTTCIGNSGPLPDPVGHAIEDGDLVAASVLSGNRNFEGRVNPHVKANYLASPMLVVAYAIAGTVDLDLVRDPLGNDTQGNEVFLKDLWPTQNEIQDAIERVLTPEMFREKYAQAFDGNPHWNQIKCPSDQIYPWNPDSTYIQEPPFFDELSLDPPAITPISGMRVLAKLGDSVTTDHISPAGSIASSSPAGKYLQDKGIGVAEFNSYGSRRGNDRVMTRGTFANIRLRNQLAPGTEGSFTKDFSSGEITDIFSAAENYKSAGVPLLILAGKEYGTGSSRDWAAKGTRLLGVKAVLAESFERIHRSNLIGMGVIPLQFKNGENASSFGLNGEEEFGIPELTNELVPKQELSLTIASPDGNHRTIGVIARIDTPVEVDYYRHGGILNAVLRDLAQR